MNPIPLLVLCFSALSGAEARNWMGIHSKAGSGAPSSPAADTVQERRAMDPGPDSLSSVGKIKVPSAPVPGSYMGILAGVRCFDCSPDKVILGVLDSAAPGGKNLILRREVWNAIERPVLDRRLYQYGRHCFYFGHGARDSSGTGGVAGEGGSRDVTCYPYIDFALSDPESPSRPEGRGGASTGWKP